MQPWTLVLLLTAAVALAGCSDKGPGASGEPTTTATTSGSATGGPTQTSGTPTTSSTGTGTPPTTTGTTTATTTTTTSSPPRAAVTWDVSITGGAFAPSSLTVQKGDTVRWTHADGLASHTVTSDATGAGSFDSHPSCEQVSVLGIGLVWTGCMAAGETFTHTFSTVGSSPYHSTPAPGATGTITVLERYDPTP